MIKKLIKINDLCKTYKYRNLKLSILENIKFEIKENEIISIIGPSGVGKSTFLNLVGLLDSFDSGEYYFDEILSGEEIEVEHQILDNKKIEYNDIFIPSGKNIELTIDLELQTILVNELKKGVKESGAESGNGIIVNPKNSDELFQAMKKMVLNKKTRLSMGKEGRNFVKKNFLLENTVKNLIHLYNSC